MLGAELTGSGTWQGDVVGGVITGAGEGSQTGQDVGVQSCRGESDR